jgi:4-hydroxy-tetrahydrodipicolinate synthase
MFSGSSVALVTPMTTEGTVDFACLQRLVDLHIAAGTDCLVIAGTTGESATLTRAEHIEVIRVAAERAAGRIPVIAGTGSNSTAQTIDLSLAVAAFPIDGYLIVTPYYNKPTQDGLCRHYLAIADALDRPVILYNVPGRTGVNLEVSTVVRLAAIPNIVGVKVASGNMPQMCDLCQSVPSDFIVLSGDDPLTLPLMSVGGRGVISVISNEMPAEMVQMVEAAERNDYAAARVIHSRIMPLMTVNFIEANPVPVKAAMAAMGLVDEVYRLPIVPPKAEAREKIIGVLTDLGLLNAAAGVSPA